MTMTAAVVVAAAALVVRGRFWGSEIVSCWAQWNFPSYNFPIPRDNNDFSNEHAILMQIIQPRDQKPPSEDSHSWCLHPVA